MKVYHEEFGEGHIINSTEVYDEDGDILSADVMFDHGIESGVELSEKLTKKMTAGNVIDDFVHSDDPKFAGKSKEERKKIALGAYYGMHPELKKEETELKEKANEEVKIEEMTAPLWGTGISKFRSFIEEEDAPVKRGRGRPKGSKSFGAAKRAGMTSDEAGGPSEPPSFTDQLGKAADSREGGHVKFDDNNVHHISRAHATAALYHLGKPEKPADKDRMRKHMGASKENFDKVRKSGGQMPTPEAPYDPDAKIKAKTAKIVGEEELKGNQKKLDKNHNGHLDSEDFKLLRQEKKPMKEEVEPKASVYVEANRYRAVESAVREIIAQNRNIREEAKEAEWRRNNPNLVKD